MVYFRILSCRVRYLLCWHRDERLQGSIEYVVLVAQSRDRGSTLSCLSGDGEWYMTCCSFTIPVPIEDSRPKGVLFGTTERISICDSVEVSRELWSEYCKSIDG